MIRRYHLTSDEVRELLIEFDAFYGSYPEHQREGYAVWKFIDEKLSKLPPTHFFDNDSAPKDWEIEIELEKTKKLIL